MFGSFSASFQGIEMIVWRSQQMIGRISSSSSANHVWAIQQLNLNTEFEGNVLLILCLFLKRLCRTQQVIGRINSSSSANRLWATAQ